MTVRLIQGDCRDVLATLPDRSVQCVVTSPPYYQLRSYLPDGHPDKAREIGGERSVAAYVTGLVAVFRAVRRVLRDDGTLWLNLGDGYCNESGPLGITNSPMQQQNVGSHHRTNKRTSGDGLKRKDLIGLPWRGALALQADGWWLRSEITWAKKAPMPESVTDRPASATEKVFLLTKSARYFYDGHAVRDPNPLGRTMRNFWLLGPERWSKAHFATFPTEIPRRAILAGTSEKGCCPSCGSPRARVVERTGHVNGREPAHVPGNTATKTDSTGWAPLTKATDTWQPACACPPGEPVPCLVLDPFAGSGTTSLVAERLGRDSIGIELNGDYITMAANRIRAECPLFADVRVERAGVAL